MATGNAYLATYRQQHLREAQEKMLSILQEIVKICERHHIGYWLDGGTLLGAARHGGFIPWDDDLDLGMTLPDLKRFVSIASKELPPHLVMQAPETDPTLRRREYKVRDRNSFFVDADDLGREQGERGIFVDIFPFVNYPSYLSHMAARMTRSMAVMYHRLHSPHYYSLRSAAELAYFGVKLPLCQLMWKLMRPLARDGKYTCAIPYYNWYAALYRADDLWPLGTITFEGLTFSAPRHVDNYLTSIFRNWRELPPPEKRKVHATFYAPELLSEDPRQQEPLAQE